LHNDHIKMVEFCRCIINRLVGTGRRTRIFEVFVGSMLKELCVLCWCVPAVNVLAVGLRHLSHTVRKCDDVLVVALNDRRHHTDRVEQLRARHVYLVQCVCTPGRLTDYLHQPCPLHYVTEELVVMFPRNILKI